MRLNFVELSFELPSNLSLKSLKSSILANIANHGEPLRWSIASFETSSEDRICLKIEAVLIN